MAVDASNTHHKSAAEAEAEAAQQTVTLQQQPVMFQLLQSPADKIKQCTCKHCVQVCWQTPISVPLVQAAVAAVLLQLLLMPMLMPLWLSLAVL